MWGKKHECNGEVAEVAHVPKNSYMEPGSAGKLEGRQTKPIVIICCSFLIQEMLILKDV